MSDMKPIKTLRLNRETVKRLGVRSSVRTGAAVYSIDTGAGGNSSSGAKGGPPKYSVSDSAILVSIGDSGGVAFSG